MTTTTQQPDQRWDCYYVTAILAGDTFDHVTERIANIISHGHFTAVSFYGGDLPLGALDTSAHDSLDPAAYRGRGPVFSQQRDEPGDFGFYRSTTWATKRATLGFGISTEWRTEADARAYLHSHPDLSTVRRDLTVVTIHGGSGPSNVGRDSRITIQSTNENGVTRYTVIVPEVID